MEIFSVVRQNLILHISDVNFPVRWNFQKSYEYIANVIMRTVDLLYYAVKVITFSVYFSIVVR